MKINKLIFNFLCFSIANSSILINEYSASNLDSFTDNYDKYEDWIELYNNGPTAIDISNYYLSDDENNISKWSFPPSTTIDSDDFLIIWCSGRDESYHNNFHSNFKLKQTKQTPEQIILSTSQNEIVDIVITQKTQLGHSIGRSNENLDHWKIYTEPTLGSPNLGSNYDRYAEKPTMSLDAGFYSGLQTLEILSSEPNSNIFYTIDGFKPSIGSYQYVEPFLITETKIVKSFVVSFDPNILPSFIEFNTYFIDENHSLPVISSATNDFQELLNGDWSLRPHGTIEYFNSEGNRSDYGYGEYNKHGQDSWAFDQRSFDYIARDEMGYHSAIKQKLFNHSDRNEFQRLIMRASGDDNYPGIDSSAHMRDIFIQTLADKHNLNLDMRRGERCIVYANGEFWGIYSIREKASDSDYTNYYYNQDKYNIQYVKNWGDTWAQYGGQQAIDDWYNLRDLILSSNLSNQTSYEYITSQLDITSLVDYVLVNSFVVCTDWVNWNTSVWRGLDPNGSHQKWGLALWDEDATFNHYINYTNIPNEQPNAQPCYPEDINDDPLGVIQILNKLTENSNFNQYYHTRYMDLLNSAFQEDQLISLLESIENSILPDMPQHIARWGGDIIEWQNNVSKIKNFIINRVDFLPSGLNSCYNLTGPYELSINVQPYNSSSVKINSISIDKYSIPWTGKYHGGVSIEMEILNQNNFDYWIGSHPDIQNTFNPEVEFRMFSDLSLIAYFSPDSASGLIINEINYNSSNETNSGDWFEIYNSSSYEYDLSNYIFKDDSDDHSFVFPPGTSILPNDYIVICKDSTLFMSQFSNVNNLICGFNFGLSGNGDAVRLFNSQGMMVDVVNYEDELPWPVEPDGEGSSLELVDFLTDNAVAENWSASSNNGTPGFINSVSLTGDLNIDGLVNILDLIELIDYILNNEYTVASDLNEDEITNILDAIILINNILDLSALNDATFATHFIRNNELQFSSNGYISSIQIEISHNSDFKLELTNNCYLSKYKTNENNTIIFIIEPKEEVLLKAYNSFQIEKIFIANSNEIINKIIPSNFRLMEPYPNPFNGYTNINFSIPIDSHITIKVFNLLGKEVTTLLKQDIYSGYHSITWNASTQASGVYFIKMITENYVKTKKIILLK